MNYNNPEQKIFYIYDRESYAYIGTGDSLIMSENSTFESPDPIPEGKVAYYDINKNIWEYKNLIGYLLDEDGFFLHQIQRPYHNEKSIVDILPPADYIKPYWNGKEWEDKPINNLYKPEWNSQEKKWIESASKEEIIIMVDSYTYQMIREWCFNRGKCEEYYLNKGIQNSSDSEYKEYLEARNKIIAKQKEKKKL